MKNRKAAVGLSIFLVVSFGLTYLVFATLQRNVSGDTKHYSALFTDAFGLRSGDDVRMAGVRVGRVDSVELDGTLARVDFQVEVGQTVYGNTRASIRYQNIIGQRYVGLSLADFGDPSTLSAGDTIPVEHTEPSFDISNLLNGFEPLFSTLDPEQVDNVTGALITALQGDTGSVTTLIAQTTALTEAFAGRDAVLGDIITNLNSVVGNLARQSGNFETTIAHTRDIMAALSARRDELLTSVDGISQVTGSVAAIFGEVGPDLTELIEREPGFTSYLVANTNGFAYLGANLPLALKGLARAFGDGSYVNFYVCDINATLIPALSTLIPTIIDLATPGGVAKHSAACR